MEVIKEFQLIDVETFKSWQNIDPLLKDNETYNDGYISIAISRASQLINRYANAKGNNWLRENWDNPSYPWKDDERNEIRRAVALQTQHHLINSPYYEQERQYQSQGSIQFSSEGNQAYFLVPEVVSILKSLNLIIDVKPTTMKDKLGGCRDQYYDCDEQPYSLEQLDERYLKRHGTFTSKNQSIIINPNPGVEYSYDFQISNEWIDKHLGGAKDDIEKLKKDVTIAGNKADFAISQYSKIEETTGFSEWDVLEHNGTMANIIGDWKNIPGNKNSITQAFNGLGDRVHQLEINSDPKLKQQVAENTKKIGENGNEIRVLQNMVGSFSPSFEGTLDDRVKKLEKKSDIVDDLSVQVDKNTKNIATNKSDIVSLDTKVSKNTNDISGLDTRVTELEKNGGGGGGEIPPELLKDVENLKKWFGDWSQTHNPDLVKTIGEWRDDFSFETIAQAVKTDRDKLKEIEDKIGSGEIPTDIQQQIDQMKEQIQVLDEHMNNLNESIGNWSTGMLGGTITDKLMRLIQDVGEWHDDLGTISEVIESFSKRISDLENASSGSGGEIKYIGSIPVETDIANAKDIEIKVDWNSPFYYKISQHSKNAAFQPYTEMQLVHPMDPSLQNPDDPSGYGFILSQRVNYGNNNKSGSFNGMFMHGVERTIEHTMMVISGFQFDDGKWETITNLKTLNIDFYQ